MTTLGPIRGNILLDGSRTDRASSAAIWNGAFSASLALEGGED